ncbi:MAG: 50S ribosomal protein L10 [Candidatus Korarchaeota archaeon]|nr:50S ribosomal protein L10 [Candidatus Korarchaeota archaeon]
MSTVAGEVRRKQSPQRIRKARMMERFIELAKEYPTIMLADFARVPADHFQRVRKELAPDIKFFVIKKRLVQKAAERMDRKGIQELVKRMPMSLVAIFSRKDPFETYRLVTEKKAEVFLKPGDVAEEDIVIPKGPTDIAPGPILTDLRAMGIPTKIQGGKIAISEDFTIVKKGETASPQVADLLRNLNIKPLKVGFKVTAAIDEDGLLYLPEILSITREDIMEMVIRAHSAALNLALEMGEINRHTVRPLTERAVERALALALEAAWLSDKTIPLLIRKAAVAAKVLQEKVS